MARACSICTNPASGSIDGAVAAGVSVRSAAKQFGVSHQSLQRHVTKCVVHQLEAAALAKKTELSGRLLAEIEALHSKTLQILALTMPMPEQPVAETGQRAPIGWQSPHDALRALAECRKNLTLIAKMTGQLQPEAKPDSAVGCTWEEFVCMYKRTTTVTA